MTMTAQGVAKLIEECGELTQILGKKLAYWNDVEHPDGVGPIDVRIECEMADVIAAIDFVIGTLKLDAERIDQRIAVKLEMFRAWHVQADAPGIAVPS